MLDYLHGSSEWSYEKPWTFKSQKKIKILLLKKHGGKQIKKKKGDLHLCYLKMEFLPIVRITYVSCFEYFDRGKEVCWQFFTFAIITVGWYALDKSVFAKHWSFYTMCVIYVELITEISDYSLTSWHFDACDRPDCLWLIFQAVTAPMSNINAIAIEAYKKYIMVSLIHHGQVCPHFLLTLVLMRRLKRRKLFSKILSHDSQLGNDFWASISVTLL